MSVEVVHLGCAGHLCAASSCHWRRHTQVGNKYRISTLGNYYPGSSNKRKTLGYQEDSFFETMVFGTTATQSKKNEGCGCHEVKSWSELECEMYPTAKKAQVGHEKFIEKYTAICQKEMK